MLLPKLAPALATILPVLNVFVVLLNVKLLVAPKLPLSLNWICVLLPVADTPPPPAAAPQLRLPAPSVVMKYPDVPPVILRLLTSPKLTLLPVKLILPDAVIVPLPNVLLAVALPTVSVVNVPVLVILGCVIFVVTNWFRLIAFKISVK